MKKRPVIAAAERRAVRNATPGSSAGRAAGCHCSPVLNHYGRGAGDERHPVFEIAPDCAVHGARSIRAWEVS